MLPTAAAQPPNHLTANAQPSNHLPKQPPRPAWVGYVFLAWTAIVLGVYVRQLLENAAGLGLRLGAWW